VTPELITDNGRTFGRIGVKPKVDRALSEKLYTVVRYGPLDAIPRAFAKVWDMSVFSLKMMGRMITGDISWRNLSGPITIADYAGQSAQLGLIPYITFLALISISLGVLNLLPIPVLDGGQLMYYIAEILKGSAVSEKVMEIGQQVGLTLLLGLTAFAFYNDIHRLVTGS
jgi:regulator of sigma E protease